MVELLPRVFCLFYLKNSCRNSQQIWLVDCSSKILDLLPQLKDGKWLNCSQRCNVSNHNLPELCYSGTAFHLLNSLLLCFLSGERLLERSTHLACWPFEQCFDLLPELNDGKWLSCSPRCFVSNHTWILIFCWNFPSYSLLPVLSREILLDRSTI